MEKKELEKLNIEIEEIFKENKRLVIETKKLFNL